LLEKEGSEFKQYVLRTINDISMVMHEELVSGLSNFYSRVEGATKNSPEQAWAFTQDFTSEIPGVGPVLMSDFLKNIGYSNFVKIDFHLKREFPVLLAGVKGDARSLFVHAWHLCEELGMTPFIFDHIMYQWGRSKL
jgi:thermostable 8-oxoguanine DNA glycosylase